MEADDGQIVPAEREHLAAAGQAAHVRGLQLHRFDDRDQRDDVRLRADRDGLAIDDRQSQWQGDDEARAFTTFGAQLDLASQLLHVTADDVHANAATRNVRGFFGSRKSGEEDQIVNLFIGQGIVGPDEIARARLGHDPILVESGAVIGDFHGDVAASVARIQMHGAERRLARGDTCIGRLDAVIDTVADEVDERIADLFEHGLVEFGLLSGELELDLLAQALREIANHARETAEDEADRQHAHAHDAFLQLARIALELRQAGA